MPSPSPRPPGRLRSVQATITGKQGQASPPPSTPGTRPKPALPWLHPGCHAASALLPHRRTFALRSHPAPQTPPVSSPGVSPSDNECAVRATSCLFLCFNGKEPRHKTHEKKRRPANPGNGNENFADKDPHGVLGGDQPWREGKEENLTVNRMQHESLIFFPSAVDSPGERAVINCGQCQGSRRHGGSGLGGQPAVN